MSFVSLCSAHELLSACKILVIRGVIPNICRVWWFWPRVKCFLQCARYKATCLRLLCGAHAQSGYSDCLPIPPCKIWRYLFMCAWDFLKETCLRYKSRMKFCLACSSCVGGALRWLGTWKPSLQVISHIFILT